MAPSREAWAEAFARQARSDWRVCDYTFPNLNLRDTQNGRRLLSLVRRALDEFEQVRIT